MWMMHKLSSSVNRKTSEKKLFRTFPAAAVCPSKNQSGKRSCNQCCAMIVYSPTQLHVIQIQDWGKETTNSDFEIFDSNTNTNTGPRKRVEETTNSDLEHFDSGRCANDLTVICVIWLQQGLPKHSSRDTLVSWTQFVCQTSCGCVLYLYSSSMY